MNNRFSSSKEIEEIYYNLLIKSGQALVVKFLTSTGELVSEFSTAVSRIGRAGIADDVIEGGAALSRDAKFGLKTIGTNIPILSEEDVRAMNPDYMLVLPWHFINEFVKVLLLEEYTK